MTEAYFGLRHTLDIITLCAAGVIIAAGAVCVLWTLWKNRRRR